MDLNYIQKVRLQQLIIARTMNSSSVALQKITEQIQYILELPINQIKQNILIQEELFKVIVSGTNIGNPSFYSAFIVSKPEILHEKFFKELEPYIDVHIFDNNQHFKEYIIKALLIVS